MTEHGERIDQIGRDGAAASPTSGSTGVAGDHEPPRDAERSGIVIEIVGLPGAGLAGGLS